MANTSTIVLFCADYRGETANKQIIEQLGEADRLIALGSSLGVITDERQQILFEDIEALCGLHGCISLVIVDHMDCGMYRVTYGKEQDGRPVLGAETERQLHRTNLAKAKQTIQARFPRLRVTTLLLEHDQDEDTLVLPSDSRELIGV